MSLILCRHEPVKHPYYIENLGISIYSSQELCYVIYNHPFMVLDGFVDEHLIQFIRDELDMGFMAMKLERWQKSGENPDDLLIIILQECDYYNSSELSKFRQQIHILRKMNPLEYMKNKADYLFLHKQYGKAIAYYEKLAEELKQKYADDSFHGKVYNNLGTAYARIFQLSKAFYAFDTAYGYLKDLEVLKKLYYLHLLDGSLTLKDRYLSIITEELRDEWNLQVETAREEAQSSEEVVKLEELFQKDPIKKMAGAAKMVHGWKQEYRTMV